jgi:1,4-alpha-glucan branching enzyme
MGQEFGQRAEWSHEAGPDWHALADPRHAGLRNLVRQLNRLHRESPALHRHDFEPEGFAWIDCEDRAQSVMSFLRRAGHEFVVVVLNFTPVVREGYRVGVPAGGDYAEILNSDASAYGGGNVGNLGRVRAISEPRHGQAFSVALTLPPLAALVLRPI